MIEAIDAQDFTRTLTGFDEVAITRLFSAPLGELEGSLVPRALLFIAERRDGMNDADAFRKVMEMTLGDVEKRFKDTEVEDLGKAQKTSGQDAGPTS